jgi:transposase
MPGIKIDSSASELLGKSGREMIEALIAGERSSAWLADSAKGVVRRNADALEKACDGRFSAEDRQMFQRLHIRHDSLMSSFSRLARAAIFHADSIARS